METEDRAQKHRSPTANLKLDSAKSDAIRKRKKDQWM